MESKVDEEEAGRSTNSMGSCQANRSAHPLSGFQPMYQFRLKKKKIVVGTKCLVLIELDIDVANN